MKFLYRVFNYSLTSTRIDLYLVRVVSWSVGVGVLALVAATLPRHAANSTELALSLGLAVLNCLIEGMYGTLSHRVQSADLVKKIPWRSRLWEWGGYAVGFALLLLGMGFTSILPFTRAGFISAFLLILAVTLATFCVGLSLTLKYLKSPPAATS